VVVVDDHELLRTGTRQILDDTPDFVVVGEAGDGDEALCVIATSSRMSFSSISGYPPPTE
jgi:DNA-binding NarL/FixJ family response regulator